MLDCAAELRDGIFKSVECDLEKPSAFTLFNLVLGAPNMSHSTEHESQQDELQRGD